MTTMLVTHPIFMEHDTGPGHPERPERLQAVLDRLNDPAFAALERMEAPEATLEAMARVHPRDYIRNMLAAVPETGLARLDPDTIISPQSGEAAKRAAGGVCAAVKAVADGNAKHAFCAVRPPGHHAEPARAMGFCLFNNIAIGALEARHAFGFERVAVVDFDVHHGNGTETVFRDDPGLFYASTHQSPFYPGTGSESETGAAGNIVNVELGAGSGSDAFRAAFEDRVLPALDDFAPDFLMLSAGFDGHEADPLALLELQTADYAWVTEALCRLAARHCDGRVVSVLEGGYNLDALADSVGAHVTALMGEGDRE